MAEPLRYRRPQSDSPGDARPRTRMVTPGVADELGERQFTVDASSETLLETLRFRREFGDMPQFETALRASVESTRDLRHASLSTIASVERDDTGLCLVSKLPSGRRLSELPPADNGWTSALKTVRELMPALLVLHENGVAHGTLSARRVVVTREGRLVLVEHVLASAIASLNLSRTDLRAMDIVVDDSHEPVRFTELTDLAQLGFLALALLVGRPLPATDFPARVPALLDEFVHGVGSPAAAARVRTWLERVMQIDDAEPFASSQEAEAAFDALSHDVAVRLAETAGALLAFGSEDGVEDTRTGSEPAVVIDKRRSTAPAKPPAQIADARPAKPAAQTTAAPATRAAGPARKIPALTWMIAVLAVLVIAEGAVLLTMVNSRRAGTNSAVASAAVDAPTPAENAVATPTSLPVPPPAPPPARTAQPTVTPAARATLTPAPKPTITPAPAAKPPAAQTPRPTATPAARPTATPAPPAAAVAPKFGGLTITSPIELQVFRDGVLLGTTAAPIAVGDGRYSLEFVNAALGFRVTLPATVAGGQMTTVRVPVPNGRVSINAVPWAEVTIDGRAVGQTPMANLSLPIGSHAVVFTHPQLGERRQTVVVTVDGIARVTQNFR